MTQKAITRNNVKVRGTGKQPMIFAPGFNFDQNVWSKVSKEFEKDYQVVLFDYVGFGESDIHAYDPSKYSTITGYVEDLLDICSELNMSEAVFIGHSIGSMIGMLASIKAPNLFSKLIMIGPSPYLQNEPPHYIGGFEKEDLTGLMDMLDKNYMSWATNVAATIVNDPTSSNIATEIEDLFSQNDPYITRKFADVVFFSDNRKYIPQVTVPSFIIQCSDDIFVPTTVAEYMHKHLSNSTITYAKAIGHCPHLSHPNETIDIINEYLNIEKEITINN
ncbi:alpha/beta fold hydrolase [Aquibacillus kalidii]|uniref:alpha/beta fold hydrolase n=1 Tax=Aquibacillus kalidii TaxID=2762597 RepID=UPI0016493D11|nr:alpha/beta hydrolase [Aquibacillus kalidii]